MNDRAEHAADARVKDPVCGMMSIRPRPSIATSTRARATISAADAAPRNSAPTRATTWARRREP
jgi:hypothetical protein